MKPIDCSTEIYDANYTWTEDPFGPDYEIVGWYVEMGMAFNPKNIRHHLVLHKELWVGDLCD